jgi:arylsulfatase
MPPNVLLVVLDSVRADNTSLCGYHRETTPFLDSVGDDWTVFRQARAPSVASLPSHVSMFTGYHPEEHELYNDDHREYRLQPGVTIWEELEEDHGYRTGIFSENPYLTSLPVGIRSAFGTVVGKKRPPFHGAVDPRRHLEDGDVDWPAWISDCFTSGRPVRSVLNGLSMHLATSDRHTLLPSSLQPKDFPDVFLSWVDDRPDHPWAGCINLMEAHSPYTPSKEYDRWGDSKGWRLQDEIEHFRWEYTGGRRPIAELNHLEDRYDGAILEVDRLVEKILTGLEMRDVLDETVVVVTSDHGEGFGEPSRIRPGANAVHHTFGIHESQLHVPLLVKTPEQREEGHRDDTRLASLTQFPDVVRAAVAGKAAPEDEFTSDTGVLASQLPLGERSVREAMSYGMAPKSVTGRMRAGYEQVNGTVHKHLSWKDESKTVVFDMDGGVEEAPEVETERRLTELFDGLGTPKIREKHATSINSTVEERLETLGYR